MNYDFCVVSITTVAIRAGDACLHRHLSLLLTNWPGKKVHVARIVVLNVQNIDLHDVVSSKDFASNASRFPSIIVIAYSSTNPQDRTALFPRLFGQSREMSNRFRVHTILVARIRKKWFPLNRIVQEGFWACGKAGTPSSRKREKKTIQHLLFTSNCCSL